MRPRRWAAAGLLGLLILSAAAPAPASTVPAAPASAPAVLAGPAAPAVAVHGAAVLVLHEISPPAGDAAVSGPPNPMIMPADEFDRLIEEMLAQDFRFVSLEAFRAYLEGRGSVPPRAVLLTFDDGYEGVYLNARPVLARHGIPAVMFPVAKWFSPYPRPEPKRPHLTAAQAGEMLGSGLWAFAGHSYDGHCEIPAGPGKRGKFLTDRAWHDGSLESQQQYESRVWSDIMLMTQELRRLGVETRDFAAPYGEVNPTLKEMLGRAGYRYLYVQDKRLNFPVLGAEGTAGASGTVEVFRVTVTVREKVLADLDRLFPKTR